MQPSEERPDADSLQFRKAEVVAEPDGPACGICRGAVNDSYYHVAGVVCCSSCAEGRLAAQQQRGGVSHFGRAVLFGAGAALAGTIVWTIIAAVTHMEFALLAIVLGVVVGKAVTYGARGCRGRRYQIAAVLLTYASITASYIPEYISVMSDVAKKKSAVTAKADSGTTKKNPPAAQASEPKPPSASGYVVFATLMMALALVTPFLGVAAGISGLINLLIIFFGLQRAWRYTAPDRVPIMGPYPASDLSASNA